MVLSPIAYATSSFYAYTMGVDSAGIRLTDTFRDLRLAESVVCLFLSLASVYACMVIRREGDEGAPTLALYASLYARQGVYALNEVLVGVWLATVSHPDGGYRILQVRGARWPTCDF